MNSMASPQKQSAFQDQYGRQKRKLRISVTDRCNFKCVYCMPEHPQWMQKKDLLSFEELYQFCQLMVQQGIEQIRITGGEPLMRQGVVHFIAQLHKLKPYGLKRIAMTSNAHYLQRYAYDLKQAGLDDINISLDSLNPEQFKQLTQKELAPVLAGINAAKQAGLRIKINTVLIKGVNENQIVPLVQWSHAQGFEPRFIEFMPLDGDQHWSENTVVTEQQILEQLSTVFELQIQQGQGANPARCYLVNGNPVGIISTISHSFCADCDRLRLNAQGELFNCLFATYGLNLQSQIRSLATASVQQRQLLEQQLSQYIWQKKSGYQQIQAEQLQRSQTTAVKTIRKISMHMLGG